MTLAMSLAISPAFVPAPAAAQAAPSGPATASPAPSAPASTALPPADADHRVLLEAAGNGLYIVEAARLAEQRGRDPMVKAYATMVARQRSAANDELRTLMQSRGLAWPSGPSAAQQTVLGALSSLTADLFDRRFVEGVGITDHQRDVLLFESASRTARDPTLRAWAARALDMVKNHLSAAQQLPLRVQTRA